MTTWCDTNWKNSDMRELIKKVHKELGWEENNDADIQ